MIIWSALEALSADSFDSTGQNQELVWAPSVGSVVRFITAAPDYFLYSFDGLGPVASQPLTSKGPGQPGVSALDMVVPPRVVIAQAILLGTDTGDVWTKRSTVASAMAAEPVPSGGELGLGLLTFKRGHSLPDLEIAAMPNSFAFVGDTTGIGYQVADMEWLCPYPFWRTTTDTVVTIASASTPTAVANPGDALCPPLIRIYGDMTLVTVTNGTTGESFQIGGQIPAGQYVEIDTTPGQKSVELVNGGVRTNWMGEVNIASDDLFQLAVGANSVSWTAGATGGSGAKNAVFVYRPRTRGI